MRRFLLVLFLLSACTSTKDAMQTWLGAPEPRLLSSWGAPDKTAESQGDKIMTWVGRNGYGQIICQKTFISKDGIIKSFSTNCP